MRNVLLILFICLFGQISAQEKVGLKDLFVQNNLTYKIEDGKLFTGQAQHIRKNGHLVYEEYFEDGILTKSITYYNKTDKPTPAEETEFYPET